MNTMNDSVLIDLTSHFGKLLARRILACATIQLAKMVDDGKEGADEMTIEDGVRYTIGMVKRARTQAMEHGKYGRWEDAIERVEDEQLAMRHGKPASAMYAHFADQSEKLATRYADDAVDAVDARDWIDRYKSTLSRTRLAFVSKLVATVKARKDIDTRTRKTLTMRYVPKGIKPEVFVELLTRYA